MRVGTQRVLGSIAICLGVGLLSWAALFGHFLMDLEARTWDWRLRAIASAVPHNPDIKIITIDQASLDHFADEEKISWPWPRSLYVPVLEFLRKGGARVVGFDLLFTEAGVNVGDDDQLVTSVRESLPVVNALLLRSSTISPGQEDQNSCERLSQMQGSQIPGFSELDAPRFSSALLPIPELLAASADVASVNSQADGDGIFRRTRAGAYCGTAEVLTLPFALAQIAARDRFSLGRFKDQSDTSGRLLIRFFGGAGTYEMFSIHAIVASWLQLQAGEKPHVDPSVFRDSYVLIGANAPGLLDLRAVPFAGTYSGVELNATILDNVLGGHFLREMSLWSAATVTLLAIIVAGLLVVLVTKLQLLAALALILGWCAIAFSAAFLGLWIPFVVPLIAISIVLGLGFFLQYCLEGKQHRFIREAFQHYVNAEVVNKIAADPSLLSLGGERRELTMLFSDIAGFTSISERLSPSELVSFLNRFLTAMTDIVLKYDGTIDKYEGDAIIAFWNAPLTLSDHRARAVRAALECQAKLRELAPLFERDYGIDIRMRVGINTGVVTVGNFGSTKRFNYTMIGDGANLAARLEGTNKVFGTELLVSAATRMGIEEQFVWRRVADVQVKGKKEVVTVYEPIDTRLNPPLLGVLDTFEEARIAFEKQQFDRAATLFGELSWDPVSIAYAGRIRLIEKDELSFSPVWVLTEK
jgi:adenylate cyclase